MLFPKEARHKVCEGRNCPNKGAYRARGICIRKQQDDYVCVDSDAPSVIIIFRDPTIENNRNVSFALDMEYAVNKKASSRLFDFYNKHLLSYFPEGETIYLDNFIRCPASVSMRELSNDYWRYSDKPVTYCSEITKLLVNRMQNLKCLIFSDVKPLIWLGRGGLLHSNAEINGYIKEDQGNSTVLLDKCFKVEGWEFPVFYFPHPKVLQRQYERYYAPNKPYHMKFKNGRERIIRAVNLCVGSP